MSARKTIRRRLAFVFVLSVCVLNVIPRQGAGEVRGGVGERGEETGGRGVEGEESGGRVMLCKGWQRIHLHPCGMCACWRTPEHRIL